ncbi:MAG: leucine-rich repeat domain-containing protein [Treponema sp.]|nr:leucine-rich repeat domain-containing protein [Treponema sp.]
MKLTGLDLSNGATLKSLYEALSRFVDLDLSECVGESIPNITLTKVPNKANIISIKLPESVKTITSAAFSGLENLKSIDMPGVLAVEGKENSSDSSTGAFAKCLALTSVSLPEVKTLGKYSFYGCSALPYILLPKVEMVGASAFKECSNLTPISLPQVTLIGNNAFHTRNEGSFSSITLGSEPPELEGSKVFYTSITIYVPASALDAYKNTEKANWVDTLKAKVTAIQG